MTHMKKIIIIGVVLAIPISFYAYGLYRKNQNLQGKTYTADQLKALPVIGGNNISQDKGVVGDKLQVTYDPNNNAVASTPKAPNPTGSKISTVGIPIDGIQLVDPSPLYDLVHYGIPDLTGSVNNG